MLMPAISRDTSLQEVKIAKCQIVYVKTGFTVYVKEK